mmetsp:Transcript_12392/g.26067  ORF Transcript_12392/g.26067 Transcript_12392/m.26067 type:complete len:247 (-) Transcript_12392:786-1526(-)
MVARRVHRLVDGSVLREVPRGGRRGVRVHVVHLLGIDAGVGEGEVDAVGHALAAGVGLRHVVGVARVRPPQHLRVDRRSARLGVLQLLQHEHPTALAHHEPVAVLIPRPGRRLGGVVAAGERLGRLEARHAHGDDGGVAGPRQHQVALPALNVLHRIHDAVVAAGAGRGAGVVRAHEAEVHGQHCGRHVGDGERNAERVHLLGALLLQNLTRRGEGTHATHGRANEAATPELVQLVHRFVIQASIL